MKMLGIQKYNLKELRSNERFHRNTFRATVGLGLLCVYGIFSGTSGKDYHPSNEVHKIGRIEIRECEGNNVSLERLLGVSGLIGLPIPILLSAGNYLNAKRKREEYEQKLI